ncbi:MAG: cyanobactin biosynthesis system PatB/AcyB/McaB family protein [Actinobacteria bacterium]|nr:cyanobactin biosynthesis system PatB/AcyB/McaB family protein [Actinomycetota bacterium]MSW11377.1 cyanobactin biosynthesis system PatB/AcyB/McaB family protein [Actinomycetota bacterium]MSX12756.1 cyanobactin biosynthesis system PatB/AcyB/McaB family protein [Actinomycetota bacterium]MSY17427.1 cyanobactin biosynthesis system PatB/AcyB/McaB family protein [Actinomycetota bacterium]MSY41887.1 cyanobactin biosynthesis system PatB/AcyB/McaB family protein [Actinomycetota bacterium]
MFPILAPPVKRPEITIPSSTIDFTSGTVEHLIDVYIHLTHGANYDDPNPWVKAAFAPRNRSR